MAFAFQPMDRAAARKSAARPCTLGGLLDLDLAFCLHSLRLLRRRHLEHALVEFGLDLGVINNVGEAQGAFETP